MAKTAKKTKPRGYDIAVRVLERNPKADFAAVKAACARAGVDIYPISYGRAKAVLGLVPVAKRGESKKARKAKATKAPARPARRKAAGGGHRTKADVPEQLGAIMESATSAIDALLDDNAKLRIRVEELETQVDGVRLALTS